MAWCLAYLGDLAEATERAEEARQLAEAAQHDLVLAMAYSGVGRPHLIRGNFPVAVSWLRRSTEICRRGNFAPLFLLVAGDLGQALALSGSVDEGLALLEEASAQSAALNVLPTHAWNVTMLAEICALAGRRAEATAHLERGLGMARAHKQRWLEAEGLRILGQLHATGKPAGEPMDVEGARAAFEEAIAIARDMGLRPLLGRCQLALGRALNRAGERRAARGPLEEAAALFTGMDMRFWLDRAEAALGDRPGR
jgi:tetratricopeptide (TPR) repeat protein